MAWAAWFGVPCSAAAPAAAGRLEQLQAAPAPGAQARPPALPEGARNGNTAPSAIAAGKRSCSRRVRRRRTWGGGRPAQQACSRGCAPNSRAHVAGGGATVSGWGWRGATPCLASTSSLLVCSAGEAGLHGQAAFENAPVATAARVTRSVWGCLELKQCLAPSLVRSTAQEQPLS